MNGWVVYRCVFNRKQKKENVHRTLIATTIKVGAETTFLFFTSIFYHKIILKWLKPINLGIKTRCQLNENKNMV